MRRIVIYQLEVGVYRKRATVLASGEVAGDDNMAQTVRDHMTRLKERGLAGKTLEQRILRSFSNGYLMARFDDARAREERARTAKEPELSRIDEQIPLQNGDGGRITVRSGMIEQRPLYDDDPSAMEHARTVRLHELMEDVWRMHRGFGDNEAAVAPSAPILFFGDLNAYLASAVRVLTVAKNPSQTEFPPDKPFTRFPALEAKDRLTSLVYRYALTEYFKERPYSWFKSWYPLLEGLGCSFYGDDLPNTALHTDLCSPLATNPAWSRLDQKTQSMLMADGVPLWHNLVDVLQPDIIILSFARGLLEHVGLEVVRPWKDFYRPAGKRAKTEVAVATKDGSRSLLVFGTHAQNPFGHFKRSEKLTLGRRIAREWKAM